jgi:hypothetical protein
MVDKYGVEIVAPFIIDTPRQQEQNDLNYESMISLILNALPKQQQVFLCALDDPLVQPFKNKAQVIYLNQADYEELRSEMADVIDAK